MICFAETFRTNTGFKDKDEQAAVLALSGFKLMVLWYPLLRKGCMRNG
jgi:hypothetical protein